MTRLQRFVWGTAAVSILAALGARPQGAAPAPTPVTWTGGDVFVAVGNGRYKVYANTGSLKETLTIGGSTDLTAGGAFDSQFRFYGTNFTQTKVVRLAGTAPHIPGSLTGTTIDTNANSPAGQSESIVFDAAGNFYVGHAAGDKNVLMYDAAGAFQSSLDVLPEAGGSDWVELSTDQKTLFYTSQGTKIRRYNSGQLSDVLLDSGALTKAFALRLLGPSFNGDDGFLVANNANIRRISATGQVVTTYDASGQDDWHSVALDPDGTSFWAGDWKSGRLYKFTFGSSAPVLGPITTGANQALGGIAVLGQKQLNIVPLVYDAPSFPALKVKQTAEFGDPAGTTRHTWSGTYDRINAKFILVLSATLGVDPARLDPKFLNASPIPYFDADYNDQIPGQPVVYSELNPPSTSAVPDGTNVRIYVAFHQPPPSVYTPPACLASATGNMRLLVDPSDDTLTPPGLEHDFVLDSTLFVNFFGQFGDPVGGSKATRSCDYVIADRCIVDAQGNPITGATASYSSPNEGARVNEGAVVSLRLDVANSAGSVNDAITFPNDITLSVADPDGKIIEEFFTPGGSPSIWSKKGNGQYGAGIDTDGFRNGVHHFCATSVSETGSGSGQFPPVCVSVNIVNSNVP